MIHPSLSILLAWFSVFTLYGQNPATLRDTRDGKEYPIVEIGNQTWMSENLAFNAGKGTWAYGRNEEFVPEFGYLYRWKTALKVCPEGWSLPSKEDYEQLLKNLDTTSNFYYHALIMGGSSGFNAKLGGFFLYKSKGEIHEQANFWTKSRNILGIGAIRFSLFKKDRSVCVEPEYKSYGFSVRCIRK